MQTKTLQTKRALRTALLVLLLGVAGMGKGYAQYGVIIGDLKYDLYGDDRQAQVVGLVNYTDSLIIIPPSVIYGEQLYSVTSIGRSAFHHDNITTVEMPNSILYIKEYAFDGCNNLAFVEIPNSVIEIGEFAFGGCALESISIPSSVQWIYGNTFNGTRWYYNQPDGVLYLDEWCLGYKGNPTGSLTIREGTRKIAVSAFSNCTGFTGSLTIPNSVSRIGNRAFSGCSGFSGSLFVGSSLIGPYAFSGCSGFTGNLTIGNSVNIIGWNAFEGCSGFSGSLTIGSSVTRIGWNAFTGCSGITDVYYNAINSGYMGYNEIDEPPHELCYTPFYECSGKLTIGDGVIRIPEMMFAQSNFTGHLSISNTVKSIGRSAFYGCSGFTGNLIIPNSVTEIGGGAFEDCTGFTGNLHISNSVTYISPSAFDGSNDFESVRVEMGNPVYDSRNNCNAIIETSTNKLIRGFNCSFIPNSVTEIGYGAFDDCERITSNFVIPNSVTMIGERAFVGCNCLGSLYIPNSVTSIGENAFAQCSFDGLYVDIINIPDYAFIGEGFKGPGFKGNLVIGNSVNTIGVAAFYGSNFTGNLIIPNSVTEIGCGAFMGCSNFNDCIVLCDTPPQLNEYFEDSYCGRYIFDETLTHLFVPCGRKAVYEASDWANYFTAIEENCGTHTISIGNISFHGGSVIVSDTIAEVGEEVQITVTPDDGMIIDSILVYNPDNPSVVVQLYQIGKGSSIYAFLMPSFDVEIKVVFKPGSAVGENSGIEVSVYPNPTNGQMKIEAEGIKSVCINNMLGQVIHEGEACGDVFEYDFGKHEAGVYLVRIETARGVITKKVTVTK